MLRTFEDYERRLWPVLGALARRGYVAQPTDAHDLIHDFFVDEWSSLQAHYDPSRGSFERYLFGAFYRFARQRIARFYTQQRRMVEIDSAFDLAAAEPSLDEWVHGEERASDLRGALARLPEIHRRILEHYLSDAADNERDRAKQLGITRYRLRETLTDAVGRLATELNRLRPVDTLERRVATALWRDGKSVSETAAELGVAIPAVQAARKRIVQDLLNGLNGSSASRTSGRNVVFRSENARMNPLEVLKRTLLSRGDEALLWQVRARAPEIIASLDEEDQDYSESEQEALQADPEWTARVYEMLAADDTGASKDEDDVEASIAEVLTNEESEIGEAFAVMTEGLPHRLRDWRIWFSEVPLIGERAYAALSKHWTAHRAGEYASELISYGITPATVFEATVGVSLLLERYNSAYENEGAYEIELALDERFISGHLRDAVGADALLAQIRATPDCPLDAAAPLLAWLFAVGAYVPRLFEGYEIREASEQVLRIVSTPTEGPSELLQRWTCAPAARRFVARAAV